ncbi:hypothetical protein MHPYR_640029 [uncultured Mycobacterium sp.]|uniref:Uncharacterized protein n=1 Tax=uncultured Mycobacterium sp. TaxID=171292 RepID=A0A1Y5NXU2_9MYCO|nr:hypothetical protein MHPYR_100172 [uncultured Mycobacterium sp.]SBS78926.1 hypothetical protein MHPYR_640029 [uncultured Mycobacterium sp.]
MTTEESGSLFRSLGDAVQTALDQLNSAVESGDEAANAVAYSNLLGALVDATLAASDALHRFRPFTEPGFFSDEAPDFNEVVDAGLDLDADAVISRELIEALAVVEETHRGNPVHREFAKAMAPGPLAMRAVMKLERELNALRREVRGE